MSVFIGEKGKRVELAERKDATNHNLFTGSKDFTGNWINLNQIQQKDKYLDFTAIYNNWAWNGISQYIDVKAGETFTASTYIKADAGLTPSWYIMLNNDGEGGHTMANTSLNVKKITTTGDWQRTSVTFTVTSDGTIKPRIESTGTTPFWFAGMKLEKGAVATPWCPAIADYAMKPDLSRFEGTQTLNNPDFNTVTASGIYYITVGNWDGVKNIPVNNWGTLVVSSGNNAKIVQVYYPDNDSAPWYRMKVDQAWRNWQQLGTKADVNAINSKVNVDGPLFKRLTQFDNWSDLFDGYSLDGINATNGNRLVAFRDDIFNSTNTVGKNGTGVAFGGGDTKGVLSVSYNSHTARIAGGNGNAPVWHEDIAWKSDLGTKLIKDDTADINALTTEGKFFVITNNLDHFPTDYRNQWYFLEVSVTVDRIKQTVTPDLSDVQSWTMTRTGVINSDKTINWKSWLITDYANGKVLKVK